MANVVGSSVCRTAVDEGKAEDWVPGGERQKVVDPMKMFHELPREQLFITAVSYTHLTLPTILLV